MRLAGRISDWNDDRGFGFVTANGGGTRAFVHIKSFPPGSRRPADGDLVSFEVTRDRHGRANAANVRFAGQKIVMRARDRGASRYTVAMVSCAMVVGVMAGFVPAMLAVVYLGASLVSYVLYCLDKAAAERSARRIPESTLHLVDLLGGWLGALVAQQQFRNKTVKASFQWVFRLTVVANVGAAAWLVHSVTAGALRYAEGGCRQRAGADTVDRDTAGLSPEELRHSRHLARAGTIRRKARLATGVEGKPRVGAARTPGFHRGG
jgi:uncharacterized membrane protein YsdA (DUF1294 family)/cold shock CspA family protein